MVNLTNKKLVGVGLIILIITIISGLWLLKTPLNNRQNTLILEKTLVNGEKIAKLRPNGTVVLRCVADFSKISYGKVEIIPGTFLKAWTNCAVINATGVVCEDKEE